MKEDIDKIGLEMEVGIPIVVKSYKEHKNSFMLIMLTKYQLEGNN